MADKKVTIELTATSSQFSGETDKAAAKTRGLSEEAKRCGVSLSSSFSGAEAESSKSFRKMGEDADTYKHKLEELKQLGGRRSALGETLETLKGAGAVAGISILGEELNKASEKAAELSKEFREGKVDAMGLAVGIAESLPVIGSFVSAGQNIREIFTHEKEQIAEINEEIKTGNELMEQRVKTQEDVIKGNEDITEKLRKANQELALANAKTPEDREKLESKFKVDDKKHDNDKDQEEFAKKRQEDLKKELELIQKQGEQRRKAAEELADARISRYDGDSDEDNENMRADAKRQADFSVDSSTQQQERAAQDKAKIDVEAHKRALEQINELDKQAAEKNLSNKQTAEQAKKDQAEQKQLEEAQKEIQRVEDEAAKKIKQAEDEAKKKADEEVARKARELADLKAEGEALKTGGDPEAAKRAKEDGPEITAQKELNDEIRKRNELLAGSETPLQKFKKQLEEIAKLQKDGLLTQEQARQMAAKDQDEYKKAMKKESNPEDTFGKAEITGERRFGFAIQNPQNANDQLQTTKDQLAEQKKWTPWFQMIWQQITQGTVPLVSLDSAA